MAGAHEVEIKFRVAELKSLESLLDSQGFHLVTARTHESNTVFDMPGEPLRKRGALLRVRQYGSKWTITYKEKDSAYTGPHKSRREIETVVADGEAFCAILRAAGFIERFRYEKFRSEWADAQGHVVLDQTPIGDFGEIEGPAEWIDVIAGRLGIPRKDYITASYAELFSAWKRQTGSEAEHMVFGG